MASSIRETALAALYMTVKTAVGGLATVERNGVETVAIPPGGLVTVRDGEPGEPEVYLCTPPLYGYEHRAEIVVQVQHQRDGSRSAALSGLLDALHTAVAADPTLGETVELCEMQGPETQVDKVEGGPVILAALVPVILSYVSDKVV